jgi:protein gp37
MKTSKIEWTECTWNPVTGCTWISSGCDNCYAKRMAKRLSAMKQPNYKHGFKPTFHEHVLMKPLKMAKPRMIFVNSMSDTFHESFSDEEILKIFKIMNQAHWHTFQVLTKRSERLKIMSNKINWTSNIWMGVTVEHDQTSFRIEDLRNTGAETKFLSIEPLIGSMPSLDLSDIDWVIVGGESGPGARKMERNWVIDIKKRCYIDQIPFFFKQWGGVNKKKNGRLLENKTWDQLPVLV